MKTTEIVQRDVIEELAWDPAVDSTAIGATVVDGGIVHLSGDVGSYGEKLAAEKAALRITGVKAVVNDLNVKLLPALMLPDDKIALAATDALRYNVSVPQNKVTITVENGWVTLRGEVSWQFQRRAAEEAVRPLFGVKGVANLITIAIKPDKGDIRHRIEDAYKRNAQIDAGHVEVDVLDGTVTLKGTVSSWAERKQAENAAWSAAGVKEVKNHLLIEALVGTYW